MEEALRARSLRLVEEAAALQHPRPLLRGHLDVPRRQQEDLVSDALHAAVQRIREAASEIDQALRELLVGALQIEDHRHAFLEAVRDLLGVVEAAGQHEMDARGAARDALDPAQPARLAASRLTAPRGRRGPEDARARRGR